MKAEKILLSHPTGNQNVRQALGAFYDAGLLAEFATTIAAFDGNVFGRLAKTKLGENFERRRYKQELAAVTRMQPGWELSRMLAMQFGPSYFTRHEEGLFSIDSIYRHLDRFSAERVNKLARSTELSAVYGYEDGALEMFEAAKGFGLKCVYDLPIAYWKIARKLFDEEALRLPLWAPTLVGTKDSEKKFARKDREIELADVIICPSKFVRDSLPDAVCKSKPVYVIPFGSPEITLPDHPIEARKTKTIKVLFAGSMTQRKGLAEVFETMKMLDPAHFELHVQGSPVVNLDFYKQQYPRFVHHRSCSHAEMLKLMQSCDVFVLPSIVEGRALVQQEALACGLPIIVTKNAGAEDLVEDSKAGFLVPIRDPMAIAEKLELLFRNSEQLAKMKFAAKVKSQQITWQTYRYGLTEAVTHLWD